MGSALLFLSVILEYLPLPPGSIILIHFFLYVHRLSGSVIRPYPASSSHTSHKLLLTITTTYHMLNLWLPYRDAFDYLMVDPLNVMVSTGDHGWSCRVCCLRVLRCWYADNVLVRGGRGTPSADGERTTNERRTNVWRFKGDHGEYRKTIYRNMKNRVYLVWITSGKTFGKTGSGIFISLVWMVAAFKRMDPGFLFFWRKLFIGCMCSLFSWLPSL